MCIYMYMTGVNNLIQKLVEFSVGSITIIKIGSISSHKFYFISKHQGI